MPKQSFQGKLKEDQRVISHEEKSLFSKIKRGPASDNISRRKNSFQWIRDTVTRNKYVSHNL